MGPVLHGRPLPLAPAGAVEINHAAFLLETEEGGVVLLYGMATWCYGPDDLVGRRLAAVQLVETKAATPSQTSTAFGVDFETLRRWRKAFEAGGIEGLVPKKLGPRRASKLTEEKKAEIAELHEKGLGLLAIARAVGLDPSTVRRGLPGPAVPAPRPTVADGALEPLARPAAREAERALARVGLLCGAEPEICEGASLPFAASLLVLPALATTGLLGAFEAVYASSRAAFYSIRSLVLALVFCLLLGEARAEGLTRLDPVDLGRLLGLDRGPEVQTMRRRLEELAGLMRSAELLQHLAETHLGHAKDLEGLFYVDGHVRAYHGSSRLPKAHLARARIAAPAEVDTWICDELGEGVLVWNAEPGASLAAELKAAAGHIRSLVGDGARPTIVFDRGGYSPRLFAELHALGFHILTYRKAPLEDEEERTFSEHELTDDLGRRQVYLLADRPVRLAYTQGKKDRLFTCRQVTRLDEKTKHQTQVLTTHEGWSAAAVAYKMFSRWRQENFFRYQRLNYGLDAMDSYAKQPDDKDRSVPNPKKKEAARAVRAAKAAVAAAEAEVTRITLEEGSSGLHRLQQAQEGLAVAKAAQAAIPTRIPLGELHDDAMRLQPERKRLHDAVRMATYNATSALSRLLAPHYRRADDEARMVLREALRSPADLEVIGDELHVRINALSAPRRSRAIAGLCNELNETETLYPGTKFRLVYSVKGY
jgi:transposase-like protein